jgi:phosphopantetheine adenylyltransferase
MSSISSSTVKGLVGFDGWENVVEEYIHKSVITAFKEKLKCGQ